jgi:hypothetical protein
MSVQYPIRHPSHAAVLASELMPGGRLPREDTELMILRTAHNCRSDYEWRAHETSPAAPD